MTVTDTYTNNDLCNDALRKIGVIAIDTDATADEIDIARRGLNRMLKSWQNHGIGLWTKSDQSVTLTTASEYTLDPVRPLKILSCRYNNGTSEIPMFQLTRDEYDEYPVKTRTGTPTNFYYDRQREAARLYVWPVLASASGQTLEITYTREIEDVDLPNVADVPGEWYDAVVYGLADNLQDDFDVEKPKVTAKAVTLFREARAFDREGSVWFGRRDYF